MPEKECIKCKNHALCFWRNALWKSIDDFALGDDRHNCVDLYEMREKILSKNCVYYEEEE